MSDLEPQKLLGRPGTPPVRGPGRDPCQKRSQKCRLCHFSSNLGGGIELDTTTGDSLLRHPGAGGGPDSARLWTPHKQMRVRSKVHMTKPASMMKMIMVVVAVPNRMLTCQTCGPYMR